MKDIKTFLIGFLSCVCLVLIMGQSKYPPANKNLGDIKVSSITVFDENGKQTAYLGTNKNGGELSVHNSDWEGNVYIGTSEGGGFIITSNDDGKKNVYLGTGEGDSGRLETFNSQGRQTGYFGTDKHNDGIIKLHNKYGDLSWTKSGKNN